ncbi:cell division protein SepF [Clostridiales bacterium]|nr:cell division protein SepF [Clostridiales bacterium]
MAKFVDKIKDFIAGPYDDEYDDEYDDYEEDDYDDYEEYHPRAKEKKEVIPRSTRESADYAPSRLSRKSQPQVIDFKGSQSSQSAPNAQAVIMKPECYEDAQGICDNIKARKAVIINLEKVEFPVAQRIMDFLSGTCYSLDGTIQRVSGNIFVIGPVNFDISSDTREEVKTSKSTILPWVSQGK